jgi:hypothetical protein
MYFECLSLKLLNFIHLFLFVSRGIMKYFALEYCVLGKQPCLLQVVDWERRNV